MYHSLHIEIWNGNDLAKNYQEQRYFPIERKIGVMLISEIHFSLRSYIIHFEFTPYHTDYLPGTNVSI